MLKISEASNRNPYLIQNIYYPSGLNEQRILNHYHTYKKQILNEVEKPVILVIGTGLNEYVIKRNMNEQPIYLTDKNYDQIIHGRVISLFVELGSPTNKWCFDIDPGNRVKDQESKKALSNVIELVSSLWEMGLTKFKQPRITNTSRGYHVFTIMKTRNTYEKNYQNALKQLSPLENKYIINKRRTNENEIIIDLSPMRRRGSHVVPYALNRNGLMCMDITKNWDKFNRKDAII